MAMKYLWLALALLAVGCGGKDASPTSPGSGGTTRVIALNGSLSYGTVQVGQAANGGFTIANQGNSPMAVTGITGPCSSMLKTNFTSGTIAPGAAQAVILTFTPTEARDCSGAVTVNADHTSGINTINMSAAGTFTGVPLWTMSGSGNTVFTMPTYIRRVRIQGTWNRTSTSNFIVRIGGSTVLNEILRDSITYDGIHLTTGGVVEITLSGQIAWAFTEVR